MVRGSEPVWALAHRKTKPEITYSNTTSKHIRKLRHGNLRSVGVFAGNTAARLDSNLFSAFVEGTIFVISTKNQFRGSRFSNLLTYTGVIRRFLLFYTKIQF
jgi:hypothetical protein